MDVRDLGAADAADVAGLFARSRAAAMPWLPVLHTPDEDLAFFAACLREATGLGVDLGGMLAGFAVVRPGWLDHLYVEPDRRGSGVGRALVEAARNRVTGDVQLWVFARNAAALAFYAGRGAAEVERTDGHGNEEREPDVRLVLPGRRS